MNYSILWQLCLMCWFFPSNFLPIIHIRSNQVRLIKFYCSPPSSTCFQVRWCPLFFLFNSGGKCWWGMLKGGYKFFSPPYHFPGSYLEMDIIFFWTQKNQCDFLSGVNTQGWICKIWQHSKNSFTGNLFTNFIRPPNYQTENSVFFLLFKGSFRTCIG